RLGSLLASESRLGFSGGRLPGQERIKAPMPRDVLYRTGTGVKADLIRTIGSGETERSKWLLLAGASLGFVVVQLDVTIVNVALQQVAVSLGSGVAGLQWIVNVSAASSRPLGRIVCRQCQAGSRRRAGSAEDGPMPMGPAGH